jgi:hypothetical protein
MSGMHSPQKVTLIDRPRTVPAVELPFARAFVAACPFRFAKSVPNNPHEYCLRSWLGDDLQDDYDRFTDLIAEYGYRGRFLRVTYRYIDVEDKRYWLSKELFGPGEIINRASNQDAPSTCCKLGEATGMKHHSKTCVNYTPDNEPDNEPEG